MKLMMKTFSGVMALSMSMNVMAHATVPVKFSPLEEQMTDATMISLTSQSSSNQSLLSLLQSGGEQVRKHEPNTLLWFALKSSQEDDYAIFDVFPNHEARQEHFEGEFARALHEQAENIVSGGWEEGVLSRINNAEIVSAHLADNIHQGTQATFIQFKAAQGQADALATLLREAASTVAQTEPHTLFWVALRFDKDTFGLFDVFTDSQGREEHFSGQVADALYLASAELIEDGWEEGVLSAVQNYEIISMN